MSDAPLVNLADVKNKIKREELHLKLKQSKAKKRREVRERRRQEELEDPDKKEERLKQNVPKTLENTREFDETVVENDEEVAEDEAQDEFAQFFDGKAPKMLITTSKRPSPSVYEFGEELLSVFPNSEFVKRKSQFEIQDIVQFCINRDYTDVIIVNEDRKEPNAITLVHLPNGPTAYFKLSSIIPGKRIQGHGRSSAHKPEIIMNNFNTRLGHTIGRMFTSLFPHVPEFQGRQVATFHNQRDYIFFRRHRYVFKSGKRADLQELGPRFTLKLKWLQKGLFDPKNGEYEWIFKSEMETSRRRFFL